MNEVETQRRGKSDGEREKADGEECLIRLILILGL